MPFTVVLDTSGLTVPQLITRARNIAAAGLAPDTEFPGQAAEFTALSTAADVLEQKEADIAAAEAALRAAVLARDAAIPVVRDAVERAAEAAADAATSAAQLATVHLRVLEGGAPARPVPDRPGSVVLSYGDNPGQIVAQCESQRKVADNYQARWATTDPALPATEWTLYSSVFSRSTFTLGGLPPGAMVWVQIRATNTRGESPWSDPACIRVP